MVRKGRKSSCPWLCAAHKNTSDMQMTISVEKSSAFIPGIAAILCRCGKDATGFFDRGLTGIKECSIVYLFNKYTIEQRRRGVDIIISSNTNMPIYEQITSQIKAMIMSGTLNTGDPIPSMRALAKSLHVSVITVQKAYEDLQRDGFIETTVGRGSFVSARNRDFYQEEQQRRAEAHLEEAAGIGRQSGIPLEKLVELLTLFYQEGP